MTDYVMRVFSQKMIDQLGGWSEQTVGQGYGIGYGLDALTNAMYRLDDEHCV